MDKKCKSCGLERTNLFCSHCGQKYIHRLTWGFLLSNAVELFEMNRGFLYNLKNLTIKPKIFYREYLSGVTNKAMAPLSYALIFMTLISVFNAVIINLEDGLSGIKIFEIQDLWNNSMFIWINFYYFFIISIYFLTKYSFLESIIISLFAVPQVQFFIIFANFTIFIFHLNIYATYSLYAIIFALFLFHNFKLKFSEIPGLDNFSQKSKKEVSFSKRIAWKFCQFIIPVLFLGNIFLSLFVRKELDRLNEDRVSIFMYIPILKDLYDITQLNLMYDMSAKRTESAYASKKNADEFASFVKEKINLVDSSSELINSVNAILRSLRFVEDSILMKNMSNKFSREKVFKSIDVADIDLEREIENYNTLIGDNFSTENSHWAPYFFIDWDIYKDKGASNAQTVELLYEKKKELLFSSIIINSNFLTKKKSHTTNNLD